MAKAPTDNSGITPQIENGVFVWIFICSNGLYSHEMFNIYMKNICNLSVFEVLLTVAIKNTVF
jgi:hypothetical protein